MKGYNNKNQDPFRERVANLRYAVGRGLRRISNAGNYVVVNSAARDAPKVIGDFKVNPFYKFIRKTRHGPVAGDSSEKVQRASTQRKRDLIADLRNGDN